MERKTVLLIGASGLVGGEVLHRLLVAPEYEKIILLNRREIPAVSGHPKVAQYLIDFNQLARFRARFVADEIICTLGTTIKQAGTRSNFRLVDFEYPRQIAQIARENGVAHFLIVTASGANPKSKIFYNRVKGEIETAIREMNFPRTSIFRPSLLLGTRAEKRQGEKIAQKLSPILTFLLPLKYQPVHAEVVAQAMLTVAQQSGTGFRIYESDAIQQLGKLP